VCRGVEGGVSRSVSVHNAGGIIRGWRERSRGGRSTLCEEVEVEKVEGSAGGPYGISAAQADMPAKSLPVQREVVSTVSTG